MSLAGRGTPGTFGGRPMPRIAFVEGGVDMMMLVCSWCASEGLDLTGKMLEVSNFQILLNENLL